MKQTTLLQSIAGKRKTIGIVIAIFPLLIGIAAFVLASVGGFIDLALGRIPTVSTVADINALAANGKPIVQIQVGPLYDAEYMSETITTENDRETGRKVTARYFFTELPDGILVLELSDSAVGDPNYFSGDALLQGRLVKPTGGNGVRERVANLIAEATGTKVSELYENGVAVAMLDTTVVRGTYLFLGTGFLFVLLGLVILVRSIRKATNYKASKFYKSLSRFGKPELVEAEIQKAYEHLGNELIAQFGKQYIFKNYIVFTTPPAVEKTEDLRWVYGHTYVLNGIPMHSILMAFKDGKKPKGFLVGKKENIDEGIADIARKLPVLTGFSPEIENLYKKDSAAFEALWEKEKSAFMQK